MADKPIPEMVERLARIIDPEAFGLPPHDLGEFGMTDRDEARMKAGLAIAALRDPTEAMYAAGGTSEPFIMPNPNDPSRLWQPGQIIAATCWRAMINSALRK